MRKLFTVAFALVSSLALSQEFWVEPLRFRVKEGEEVMISAMSGEGIPGDPLDPRKVGIKEATRYSLAGKSSLGVVPHFSFKSATAGTNLISVQTNEVVKEWKGAEFDAYLEDNDLQAIIDERKKSGLTGQRVTETTVSFGKAVVQVGASKDATYQQVLGAPIEIIPVKNPAELVVGDHLKCKVMFQGKPSAHALIRVWSVLNRTTFLQNLYTEDDGTVVFPISTKGIWMISTIRMLPGENPATEWKSYRGSFMFGI